ncbi:uncharacterized protein I303_102901 [Kwoniella dejecticola CBS 10117]|uniref:Uncharacterized protein n=1 Tax=Kwoniella dejecticola CBS 10117 TaxID=1296121 RepID=A0A1A6AA13_9TREE|nr:uncharacterized protein I303_02921 [Kwoniella dejecticola CBS 10117]OBR86900.1 hypothetical protein I303_02921 [Kwoniella dejecticola CBS 10117]
MDIIHRLNPFHRPPSSLRSSTTPTPTPTLTTTHTHHGNYTPTFDTRPSSSLESGSGYYSGSGSHQYSIDTTYPHSSSENERYLSSPVPPPPPGRPLTVSSPDNKYHTYTSGHRRTPSILRSLAHHPSLSALKSKHKSKKKRKNASASNEEPIPSLPNFNDDTPQQGQGGDGRKLTKNGLKLSKSVPRDMRLSDEIRDNQDIPPIPSHPLLPSTIHNQLNLDRSRSSSVSASAIRPGSAGGPNSGNKQISIRRKPAPSPRPEDISCVNPNQSIDHDHFPTPESMRLRMKFEIDLPAQTPPGRRSESGLGLGSPRRRYMSFNHQLTPAKGKIRHLSTPADSPPRHPLMPQHAQAIPQSHLYAQSLYADSSTFFSTDFAVPSAQALDWHNEDEEQDADDGLDLFVNNVIPPPGTPGGRQEDADGAQHGSDAIRFFSRDTYPAVSPSPETTPSKVAPSPSKSPRHRRAESSPACSPMRKPIRSREAEFARAAKRSSSPFEVKLSANVTKRMSLDAFGTSSLPKFEIEEEVLNEADESHLSDDHVLQDTHQTPEEADEHLHLQEQEQEREEQQL